MGLPRRYLPLLPRAHRRFMMTSNRTYNDAIQALNSLQSNFAILSAIRASGKKMNNEAIPEMVEWVRRIGYTPSAFNKLNIIHVAGTKGKGSTCAFASSILSEYRRAGVIKKTGLYTSPHLRAVRERIQIDGRSVSEDVFARYFYEVWDKIEESAMREGLDPSHKPVYFRFLTLVAFHTYLQEGVDTAVFEVGVGGEYDSTNIIEKPTVTGITSLGIDHTGVLGNTIAEIAWHKAGIFKAGAAALTVPQSEKAMDVLKNRAREKNVELKKVELHPDIENGVLKLGLSAEFQKVNASLAIALVTKHLQALGHDMGGPLSEEMKRGLANVEWPGRCQVIQDGHVKWNIDGAHTMESLDAAGKWFSGLGNQKSRPKRRVLIFNQQNRDAPEKLAGALAKSLKKEFGIEDLFEHALFCTNVTYKVQGYKPDLMSVGSDKQAVVELTVQKSLALAWKLEDPNTTTHVLGTIEEAVEFVRALDGEVEVLVSGSLHLVGGLLEILDPNTS